MDEDLDATPLEQEAARRRLILFSIISGNDFVKFSGVGQATAARIALMPVDRSHCPSQGGSMQDALVEIARRVTNLSKDGDDFAGVLDKRRLGWNMCTHSVVWDPSTSAHRHLSGVGSFEDITKATG